MTTSEAATSPRPRLARPRLDRFEIGVLGALAVLALAPLAALLVRVWSEGGVVTGADGFFVADPLQYLSWLRDAGDNVLVRNPYDLAEGPRSFLHPGVLISGGLHRLGLGVAAAYLAWKPVAILALFAGALALVRRLVDRPDDRRLALVLALFACSPVAAAVGWLGIGGESAQFDFDFVSNEMWSGSYLWGYLFTAIAVGTLPLALLAYERGREAGAAWLALAAAGGLVCAWLQPWQGATFIVVLVGAEALTRRSLSAARDLAGPVAAAAAPLLYYYVLSRTDDSWTLAGQVNDFPRWPWYVTVLGLAPLAIPAALAYAQPAREFAAVALRVWPLAALAVFYQPAGTFPFHAFQGLAIPLAVLAVIGVRGRLGDRPLPVAGAVAAVLVLVVAGTAYKADELREAIAAARQPFFLEPGERDALRHIERQPGEGGVLTPVYSGIVVPAYTGRETWIGAGSWTPDHGRRTRLAEQLFDGRLSPPEAEALVRDSGARFLYSDCQDRADIRRVVEGFTGPPARFGCATVYEVRP